MVGGAAYGLPAATGRVSGARAGVVLWELTLGTDAVLLGAVALGLAAAHDLALHRAAPSTGR